eukprot:CAMPEP_0203652684 /NCGR_PEP_ID=MMETSP0088-20131115/30675_1 /ASSEMBLY_ACC=CAM_ASM_001087 /TAXON_ID=426623 /ORGANISM="Chaetoceros affinis, Strain CCMP159" /LENGTH=49 /DNA_ID=CAMNT_0050512315 /DNA_START=96 /DNA_END=245 /DNA_ORIENTATION=-
MTSYGLFTEEIKQKHTNAAPRNGTTHRCLWYVDEKEQEQEKEESDGNSD